MKKVVKRSIIRSGLAMALAIGMVLSSGCSAHGIQIVDNHYVRNTSTCNGHCNFLIIGTSADSTPVRSIKLKKFTIPTKACLPKLLSTIN